MYESVKGKGKPSKESDASYSPSMGLKEREEGTITRRQEVKHHCRIVPPDKSYVLSSANA